MSRKYNYSQLAGRLDSGSGEAWRVHEQAMQMRQRGEDVVILSIGDPDFRTPEPIIDNAVSHLRVGRTHYSPALGEIKLRRAVADLRNPPPHHTPAHAEEVAIFPGVNQSPICIR